jgi:hypothetical protein
MAARGERLPSRRWRKQLAMAAARAAAALRAEGRIVWAGMRLWWRDCRDLAYVAQQLSRRVLSPGAADDPRVALGTPRHARYLRRLARDVPLGLPSVFVVAVVPGGLLVYLAAVRWAPWLLPSAFAAARARERPAAAEARLAASATRATLVRRCAHELPLVTARSSASLLPFTTDAGASNARTASTLRLPELVALATALTAVAPPATCPVSSGGSGGSSSGKLPSSSSLHLAPPAPGPPAATTLAAVTRSLAARRRALAQRWAAVTTASSSSPGGLPTAAHLADALSTVLRLQQSGGPDASGGLWDTSVTHLRTTLARHCEHLAFDDYLLRREMDNSGGGTDNNIMAAGVPTPAAATAAAVGPEEGGGAAPLLRSLPTQEERVAVVSQRLPLLELLRWATALPATVPAQEPPTTAAPLAPLQLLLPVETGYDFTGDPRRYGRLLQAWLGASAPSRHGELIDAESPDGAVRASAPPMPCRYPSACRLTSLPVAPLVHAAVTAAAAAAEKTSSGELA